MQGARRETMRDAGFALLLAAVLSTFWAISDWSNLSRLILPDADDMMRLAQVRDWLAGQGINDWTQYRMAPPLGAPMHWSRVNDFGIAAIILALTPVVGRHGAELAAVLIYPGALFACHLFLVARIARRLWGAEGAPIALLLGALAYPGLTVLVPGRIDHHALQVVLTEIAVLALMRPAGFASGWWAGVVIALSLVIGLETAPQAAALLAVAGLFWVVRGVEERPRLLGLAAALAAVTAVFVALLRPTLWSPQLCDAFTPATSNATFAVAAALALLTLATRRLPTWHWRLAIGAVLGATVLGTAVLVYPSCLTGPYGAVDPFLRREFIIHIDEANSLFAQGASVRFVQIGGLMLVACVVATWVVWRRFHEWRTWTPLVAVIGISGLVMLAQVRGVYIGTPVSAPLLAGVILSARCRTTRRTAAVIGAWLVCAGLAWYQLPKAIASWWPHTGTMAARLSSAGSEGRAVCNLGDTWSEVDRFPPGVVLAPTNMASYLIGATRMSTIGAGYHRNNRGNLAMYRYFLSTPEQGRPIAARWRADYVAFCPGDFSEVDVVRRFPRSLATRLTFDRPPPWLQRLPLQGSQLRFYRIVR